MFDSVYVGKRVRNLYSTPQFSGYSRVVLSVTDDIEYTAGNDSGRTLSLSCPWGTQKLADDILNRIRGFQYQPYQAKGAQLDPAAELGDAVTLDNVYGGIYTQDITFGSSFTSDISAPEDEEIDHEFPYQPKQNREIKRQTAELRASLKVNADAIVAEAVAREKDVSDLNGRFSVQADLIEAKVSKSGGNASSFGWELLDDSWTVKASNRDVFKVTKDGAEVYGIIRATGGTIGGFDIGSDALSYNGQTWGGTNTYGAYLGSNGLQMGSKFRVDMAGNLYAASGTFEGNVNAGNIQYGGASGYFSGSGIGSNSISGNRLSYGTIGTSYLSTGVNNSLGSADAAYKVTHGGIQATTLGAATMYAGTLRVSSRLYLAQRQLYLGSVTIEGKSYNVVRWQ